MGRTSDCSKMSRRTVQYWITECRYSLIRYEGRGKGRIVQNFILVSQNWAFLLHPAVRCAILIIEKGKTTAHKGLTSQRVNRITTLRLGQSFGVVFLCLKHYLINVNTNVSNARMNIPKAIRSLKESVRNLVSLEAHASLDKSSICRNLLSILGIFCCRIFLLLLV